MPSTENLEYIDIADFTAGIYDRHASAGPAPDGASLAAGTFACYGPPEGGLYPLPGPQAGTALTGLDLTGYTSGNIHTIATAILPLAGSASIPSSASYAIMQFHPSSPNSRWALVDVTNADELKTIADSGSTDSQWGYGALDVTRVNPGEPHEPGKPAIFGVMGNQLNPAADGETYAFYYPDHEVSTGALALHDLNLLPMVQAFAHQGRAVFVQSGFFTYEKDTFGSGLGPAGGETFYYMRPKDPEAVESADLQLIDEAPYGYSSWASMNNSELFLVKQYGGAVVVRGDLSRPQVIRLPGVPSGNGDACIGCITPLGYIYGTRNGVWAWNGSDTAENLSPYMPPRFWVHADTLTYAPAQPKSKFTYFYPWVFVGNDWVLDVRTGGWWRLNNPSTPLHHMYDMSSSGRMRAWKTKRTTETEFPNYVYNLTDSPSTALAPSFQWASQPLAKTRAKRLHFREVQVTARGAEGATITVALVGYNGQSSPVVITLSGATTLPRTFSVPIEFKGHDVSVVLVSAGSVQAPSIHRISLGYREDVHI